jgi:hypothetical protein
MEIISIVNPFSSKYHTTDTFKELRTTQKLVTIFVSIIASLFSLCLATTPTFRALVIHYKKINGQDSLPPTAQKTDNVSGQHFPNTSPDTNAGAAAAAAAAALLKQAAFQQKIRHCSDNFLNILPNEITAQTLAELAPSTENEYLRSNLVLTNSLCLKANQKIVLKLDDSKPDETEIQLDGEITISRIIFKGKLTDIIQTSGKITIGTNEYYLDLGILTDPIENFDIKGVCNAIKEAAKDQINETISYRNVGKTPYYGKGDDTFLKELENALIALKPEEPKKPEEDDTSTAPPTIDPSLLGSWFTILNPVDEVKKACGFTTERSLNIINCLNEFFLTNKPKDILDTDFISFANGKICSSQTVPTASESENACLAFTTLLQKTYGKKLFDILDKRYKLHELKELRWKTVKECLVGIAANVSHEHLLDLYNELKRDPQTLADPAIGEMNCKLKGKHKILKTKTAFNKLSNKQLEKLLNAFRTIHVEGKQTEILEALYEGTPPTPGFGAYNPFEFDAALLKELVSNKHLKLENLSELKFSKPGSAKIITNPLENLPLANTEQLSKCVVYQDVREGMIVPILGESDRIERLYRVVATDKFVEDAQLSTDPSAKEKIKNEGLVFNLLAPINKSQNTHKDGSSTNVYLTFRGTEVTPSAKGSGASLARDADWSGVGKRVYKAHEARILSSLKDFLEKTEDTNITLTLSGHSLGAVDTARALVSICKELEGSTADSTSVWRKIKKIIVDTRNPPRPEPELNEELRNALRSIEERNHTCRADLKIDLEIDYTNVRFHDNTYEDFVQKAGDILLGADLGADEVPQIPNNKEKQPYLFKKSKIFKCRTIEVKINRDIGKLDSIHGLSYALWRHTKGAIMFRNDLIDLERPLLVKGEPSFTAELVDNEHAPQKLQQILANRWYWNAEEQSKGIRFLNGLSWHSQSAFAMLIKNPAHFVLDSLANGGNGLVRLMGGVRG